MKIFHVKDNTETVFVQKQDIDFLLNNSSISTEPIVKEMLVAKTRGIDDSDVSTFIEFDDELIVEFLKHIDFIIDYMQYKDLSDVELKSQIIKLQQQAKDICDKCNSMSPEEFAKQKTQLYKKHEDIIYMSEAVDDIYSLRYNYMNIVLPDFMEKI